MFQKLNSLFQAIVKKDTKQSEREAVIELMIITMYSDKSLKVAEEDMINQYLESITWESGVSKEQFLAKTFPKVRNAITDKQKIRVLLEDINSRIGSDEMKSQLLSTCSDLALADGEISEEEKEFLAELAKILQAPN